MTYSTKDIWPGIYGSHQRCLEALQRLNLITKARATDLNRNAYVELLQYRLKTAKREKKALVQQRLQELGVAPVLNGKTVKPKSKREKTKVKASSPKPKPPGFIQAIERLAIWSTSRAIIFITLLGALSIQIHHVAHLVNRVSQNDSLALGYIFGSVSEITALLLTVHQARKSMLIIFAFVQCWINILYYCHLPDLTIQLTLSALIAFVIYSYSELYTISQAQVP